MRRALSTFASTRMLILCIVASRSCCRTADCRELSLWAPSASASVSPFWTRIRRRMTRSGISEGLSLRLLSLSATRLALRIGSVLSLRMVDVTMSRRLALYRVALTRRFNICSWDRPPIVQPRRHRHATRWTFVIFIAQGPYRFRNPQWAALSRCEAMPTHLSMGGTPGSRRRTSTLSTICRNFRPSLTVSWTRMLALSRSGAVLGRNGQCNT